MYGLSRAALTAFFLLLAAPAAAQVITFATEFDGELDDEGQARMREALQAGLESDGRAEVLDEDATSEALGDGAQCADEDCARAAGQQVSARVGVHASVYAEAEIYDFVVTVYDLNDGTVLAQQIGDCTFCPIAEATEAFRFTGEAALSAVSPLPEPTLSEPESPAAADAAIAPGDLQFNVSVVPEDAEIRINGQIVGSGRARVEVGPQELVITVMADGYDELQESVTVTPSMEGPVYLRVQLAPSVTVVEVPTGRPSRSGSDVEPGFNRRSVGGVLIGSGVVAMTGGIVMLALDGNSTCSTGPLASCPTVVETTAGGIALTALGALAAGTGTGLVLSTIEFGGSDDADDDSARGTLRVAPARGGAMLSFDAAF